MVCPNIEYFSWGIEDELFDEDDDESQMVSLVAEWRFSAETTFANITQLCYQTHPTENLWRILLCLPSLRQLEIGEIGLVGAVLPSPGGGFPSSLDDFPTFALEKLTFLGGAYQPSWILHSSANSLRNLTLHHVNDGWPVNNNLIDLRTALERCGKSIRHIYLNSYTSTVFTTKSILSLCPALQSFKVSLTDLPWPAPGIISHTYLSGYLSSLHRPLEHFHLAYGPTGTFISADGVSTVTQLVERHPMLQGLKRLCIASEHSDGLRENTIRPLRRVCLEKGIVLEASFIQVR